MRKRVVLIMSSITDDEVRRQILKILIEEEKADLKGFGVHRETVKRALGVSERNLDSNIAYLARMGLVRLFQAHGSYWPWAKITSAGIDVVENKEEYKERFPFLTEVVRIQEGVREPYFQSMHSSGIFRQQVTEVFQKALQTTEEREDVSDDLRQNARAVLDMLERELKKREPDVGRIQEFWEWLKKNADWVVPTLSMTVLRGTRMSLGA